MLTIPGPERSRVRNFASSAILTKFPAMILATERGRIAPGLFRELTVTVRTDVQESAQLAIKIANDDGRFEQVESHEVAWPGEFIQGRQGMPGGTEEMLQFFAVLRFGKVVFGLQKMAQICLMSKHRILKNGYLSNLTN
jgi:hypothetical protein